VSPDIVRKSEVAGVCLALENSAAVTAAYRRLTAGARDLRPPVAVKGVSVQPMLCGADIELMLGSRRDPLFGPVIVFGAGGLYGDILTDRAIGLPPLNRALARQMIDATRIAVLLKGYRGRPAVSSEHLEETLIRLSRLVADCPEIVALDINPAMVMGQRLRAVDARIRLAPLGAVGRQALTLGRTGLEIYRLLVRTLYYCFRGRREPGAIAFYMYEVGNKSIFFLSVVMGFIGMIMVYQGGVQTLRILPELSLLGASYLELLIRDLAASIGALMLATRVGAGIAAEIGSMVVTEQVDALRMSAADPVDYLIKPRFVACLVMTTCLCIWGAAVSTATGTLTAYAYFDLNPQTFLNLTLVDGADVGTGLVKCVAYGAAIPIVSGHAGLSTHGGSEGVGQATTRAVVNSSLAVIMLNLIISATSFILYPD
jgi:phospholipid/cholesterol/gamma-HCH transport system permease protein